MRKPASPWLILAVAAWLPICVGCGRTGPVVESQPASMPSSLKGTVLIEGSSNVYPLTELVASRFRELHPDVFIHLTRSSTPVGLKQLIDKHVHIVNACRPINPGELQSAREKGLEFVELPVAKDGLVVVVHPRNTFVDQLSVRELRRLWEPDSVVRQWKDVRPTWPARAIRLTAPKVASGTFDCFTGAIFGREGYCRTDFTAQSSDKARLEQVAADEDVLTFCSYGNYLTSGQAVKLVPIADEENPAVAPDAASIRQGTYKPLLRPFFLYVNTESTKEPAVDAFVRFYVGQMSEMAREAGLVPLAPEAYQVTLQRFTQRTTGSIFCGQATSRTSVEQILGLSASTH